MPFRKLLFEAAKNLGQDEVRALVFLCADLLGSRAKVESADDLFRRLGDQDYLSEESPHLLSELLCIIQRTRLLRDLDLSASTPINRVSAYRCPVWRWPGLEQSPFQGAWKSHTGLEVFSIVYIFFTIQEAAIPNVWGPD